MPTPIKRAAAAVAAAATLALPPITADAAPVRVSTAASALYPHCGDPYWANTYNARGSVSALRIYDSQGHDHLVRQGKTSRIDACMVKVGAHRGIVAYRGDWSNFLTIRNTRDVPVWVMPGKTVKLAKVVVFRIPR